MAAVEHELVEPAGSRTDAPAVLIGRLYEQHSPMIHALCGLLLRNRSEAEDAAQQTFLSAFGSLIGGTVPERPAAWLATIARRECWARSARRRSTVSLDDDVPAAAADPLEHAIRTADLAAIWKALSDLPHQQRQAFLMREFAGLTYTQVAEALGASEPAVESLLVRARRQLRDGLGSALGAVNVAVTPLLLLQHRLGRLLGGRASAVGAGAAGATPVAAKLGAVLIGSAVLGAAGVGVGVKATHRHPHDRPSTDAHSAATPTGARHEAAGRSGRHLSSVVGRGSAARRPAATPAAATAVPTQASPAATPAGDGPADPVDPRQASSADTAPAETATVDAPQPEPAPTTPEEPTPADTTPADAACTSPDDADCADAASPSVP